jgi:4-diphosphocytidyl-2-C-methyl-D-erythritol kinase
MNASTYKIKTPAKLNIRLKVTGRRPDGYHDLVSFMVPVDLFDFLELSPAPEGVSLSCQGFPVPADETNLTVRAARAFLSKAGMDKGVFIKLEKKIPVAAGMGGGSSDAAAVLLLLNEMWAQPLSAATLYELACGLGADVPFFLNCKPSLARGIGEILEPVEGWPDFWFVIVHPPIHVSTSWVYRNLQLKELTRDDYDRTKIILKEKSVPVAGILENDLESVTSARFPVIETIKHSLSELGAEGALMTGSGPSVFGVFRSPRRAKAAKAHLLSLRLGEVFLVRKWERSNIGH